MDVLSMPSFPDERHRSIYDTTEICTPNGDLSILAQLIDDVLYPAHESYYRTRSWREFDDEHQKVRMHEFSVSYDRGDMQSWAWPLETAEVKIVHEQFLGSAAVKELYTIDFTSVIHQQRVSPNRMLSRYTIERTADTGHPFFGVILRPNILSVKNFDEEPMTRYDCNRLYDIIRGVEVSVDGDERDKQTVSRLSNTQ